jgi:hypothetical protein
MYLAFQGLPKIFFTAARTQSYWRPFYAVTSSVPIASTDPTNAYLASCNSVYPTFELVYCGVNNQVICTFEPDTTSSCLNCLKVTTLNYQFIDFCDSLQEAPSCLVGIVNRGIGSNPATYPDNCYIEVFFVGSWEDPGVALDPPSVGIAYKSGTVISSLRWSATADFMKQSLPYPGVMLNCTNHTIP